MKIVRTGRFEDELKNLVELDVELTDDIKMAIKRFEKNPKDTRLRMHALKRRLRGKYAFSVNDDAYGNPSNPVHL